MRKNTRSVLFLAALTVLLAAGAWAELGRERALAPAPVIALDPAKVQRIEVQCSGCRTRRFARTANGWRMLEPYALSANPDAIAHLLAIASARVRERHPLRDYDPAKLGLDPAQMTLTLDDSVIAIGGEDPIEHDRYVRVGDELLRVPDRFSARLLATPESEIDRHLVPPDAVVADIVIGTAEARRDLAPAWRQATASGVRAAAEAVGEKSIPISIDLIEGTQIHFALMHAGTAYIARRSDPALDYVIDEAQAQILLGKST